MAIAAWGRELDGLLTELVSSMPVDVMPGVGDPSNHALPQQHFNRCLFPGSASFPTFVRVTNPHAFTVDGVNFLGSSGMNVDDICKCDRLTTDCLSLHRCPGFS
jgi:DNA polymerase delta subunit 2